MRASLPRNRQKPLLVDPLEAYSIPEVPGFRRSCIWDEWGFDDCYVRYAEKEEQLKERITVSAAISNAVPRLISPSRAERFVMNRAELLKDLSEHNHDYQNTLKWLAQVSVHKVQIEQLLIQMRKSDALVSNELEIIERDFARLVTGILSSPAPARIGQAYLAALADSSVRPADATQERAHGNRIGLKCFDNLIQNIYTLAPDAPEYDAPEIAGGQDMRWCWCPVTHAWHEKSSMEMVQIVPYTDEEVDKAEETQARPIQDEWQFHWGLGNGMVLLSRIKEDLENNRIVIIPDEASKNEVKLIVLDDSLFHQAPYPHGPRYWELHKRKLAFKTEARPHPDNLYLRCINTLITRRPHHQLAEGGKNDLKKVQLHKADTIQFEELRDHLIAQGGFEAGDFE